MAVPHGRARLIVLLTALASAAMAHGAIHARPQSTPAIEPVVTEFLTAFSNRDFARFMPLFSEDATIFFPPSAAAPTGRVRGRNEIEQTFRTIFAKYPPRAPGSANPIRPLDLLVEEFGELSVITFHLGSEAARQRRTLVLRRLGGDWKIVHVHGSASAGQP